MTPTKDEAREELTGLLERWLGLFSANQLPTDYKTAFGYYLSNDADLHTPRPDHEGA